MVDVLLYITAGFVSLGIVLLLWPLRMMIQVWPEQALVTIKYFLIRVVLDFRTGESRVLVMGIPVASGKPLPEEKKEEKKAPEKPRVGEPSWKDRMRLNWMYRRLLRRVTIDTVRLLGRLLRAFRVDRARVALILGLSDPASTGMAAGCIYAALPTLQVMLPKWQIVFIPEFARSRLALDADIALRLIPLEPLYQIARTLGTLPWRELWKYKAARAQL